MIGFLQRLGRANQSLVGTVCPRASKRRSRAIINATPQTQAHALLPFVHTSNRQKFPCKLCQGS
jgi:hypothetical protein